MPTYVYIVREYNGFPLMVYLIKKNAEEYAAKYHKETGRRCEIDRVKIDDFEEFSQLNR